MMKIIDILKIKNKGFSFEFFPPKTERAKELFLLTVNIIKNFNPLYVSMTYGALGSSQENSKEAVYTLIKEKDLTVMPHITCIGASKEKIKNLLDEYKNIGIENIMALRGDIPKDVNDFSFSKDFKYAKDLVKFIKENYKFCIGVAVYPQGHIEDKSFKLHLEYTKEKIYAGADFAVSQMFFDNKYYYSFLEKIKKIGINIPVIAGILPLTDIMKAKEFCSVCKVTIPKKIEKKMLKFIDKPLDLEKIGLDFTIKQCRDLIKNGVNYIHFFTLNKPRVIKKVLEGLI